MPFQRDMETGLMFQSCFPGSELLSGNGQEAWERFPDPGNDSFPLFHINATYVQEYDVRQSNFTINQWPTPSRPQPMDNDDVRGNMASMGMYDSVRYIMKILHCVICIFGLIGNLLTLLILTRKRLKMSCDGTERTVHLSFTALAVSDFLLCVTLLPYGVLKDIQFSYQSLSFKLLYESYGVAVVNMFILTSTWLTVTMATSRYLAICHPFWARHVIGVTGTKASICLVFLLCAIFNIPRMFEAAIETLHCVDGSKLYLKMSGYLTPNSGAHTVYIWIYFTFGISLPLAALAFCNFCLVRALRESAKFRKRYQVPVAQVDSNYRITSILVTIVIMYILLVPPAEILQFIRGRLSTDRHSAPALFLAIEVTNLLQMINFSCNFVMYFVLNIHFRRAMRDMVSACTRMCDRRKEGRRKHRLSRQMSVRTTQTAS